MLIFASFARLQEFETPADAQKACQEYDGGKFLDATIHVSLSHGAGSRRGEGPSHCYRCGQEGHWAKSVSARLRDIERD
jgi:hypothetical protein